MISFVSVFLLFAIVVCVCLRACSFGWYCFSFVFVCVNAVNVINDVGVVDVADVVAAVVYVGVVVVVVVVVGG